MFKYYSNNNLDFLISISSSWLDHYNFLLNLSILQDWEIESYQDAILSEKVFDI